MYFPTLFTSKFHIFFHLWVKYRCIFPYGYLGKDKCQNTKPDNAQFSQTKLDLIEKENLFVNSEAWNYSAHELAFLRRQFLAVLI